LKKEEEKGGSPSSFPSVEEKEETRGKGEPGTPLLSAKSKEGGGGKKRRLYLLPILLLVVGEREGV